VGGNPPRIVQSKFPIIGLPRYVMLRSKIVASRGTLIANGHGLPNMISNIGLYRFPLNKLIVMATTWG
jgi:hypothetical protein